MKKNKFDLIFGKQFILYIAYTRTVKRSRKTVSSTCPWSDGAGGFPNFYSSKEIGQKTNIPSRINSRNCSNTIIQWRYFILLTVLHYCKYIYVYKKYIRVFQEFFLLSDYFFLVILLWCPSDYNYVPPFFFRLFFNDFWRSLSLFLGKIRVFNIFFFSLHK